MRGDKTSKWRKKKACCVFLMHIINNSTIYLWITPTCLDIKRMAHFFDVPTCPHEGNRSGYKIKFFFLKNYRILKNYPH